MSYHVLINEQETTQWL